VTVGRANTGIVVVSHSVDLALAAVALAEEMLHGGEVGIEVAAGLQDGTFGTDAVRIADAIGRADRGAGVVVLMDLGSAVLSAELALDLMDDDARSHVLLCPAPLVEGLVVAAVTAASGAPPVEVAAEAIAALAGKRSQLDTPAPVAERSTSDGEVAAFTVRNRHGLHARPAALLVQAVRGLDAAVSLRNRSTGAAPVSAASLSAVATLGALTGHEIEVTASGAEARRAIDAVLALAADGFGENIDTAPARPAADPPPHAPGASPAAGGVTAVAVSPGVVVGPARPLGRRTIVIPDTPADEPADELRTLLDAVAEAGEEIRRLRARTAAELGEAEAAVFDAHLLLLDDPGLLDGARARIRAGEAAAPAWVAAIDAVEGAFADLPDSYQRARAADVAAVGMQVLGALTGDGDSAVEPGLDGVLIAPDLTPAQAAGLDPNRTLAVVLAAGSPTSHAAILVRARGIPLVVGAGERVLAVPPGAPVAVDGGTGEVVVDPGADVRIEFTRRATRLLARRDAAAEHANDPALTRDGVHVLVCANIGSPEQAEDAVAAGADGAGLVRTEFCFLDRDSAPDVDEQEAAYREIAEAMAGRRTTLRTLDVGGDKPLAYLPRPAEANPFLGVRGLRLALARPELLADQLLAIVRVAHDHPVDLMFPMVSTLDELFAARRALAAAVAADGRGEPAGLRVGIMVEVPAAALKAAAFAPHVDFLSIGTNDLTQYALAAERGNDALTALADPFDPGLLRLVAETGAVAGDDLLVAVCGEFAADERATGLLIGLGVRELSVAPTAVGIVKAAVRRVDAAAAAEPARRALTAPDAATVRALLRDTT